ncbi:hypothetical protein GALMADRAFT_236163 [Galerina marginata CBS 339.88]|uniref:RING-type domain-containing protein n=1 Tax=Galerina marginata (strain CBS 339.88) TaxID=685588 RepID=A0A067TXM2_GALM3|nr:hypothetical protein GALMADRAFT_236163 [Galerina marginata CBS 339.88]
MDRNTTPSAAEAAYQLVQVALLSPHERIKALLASLPFLGKESVDLEEPCPICLMPFATVFAEAAEDQQEEEMGLAGVTKLVGCGHVFCRRDLTEWIRSQHGSCPTCRHTFLDIRPPSESDDESSDGGEYIPNLEDFEDEDDTLDVDVDEQTDTDAEGEDFPVQGVDLDFDEMWDGTSVVEEDPGALGDAEMGDDYVDDEDAEWGLTDGESESMSSSSEGDTTMEDDEGDISAGTSWLVWRRSASASRVVQLTLVALLLFSAGNGG